MSGYGDCGGVEQLFSLYVFLSGALGKVHE
ncbi:MAG: hypothetical protein ACJATV_000787 [Granulosicoccus sp.]|jgi:hypothetical protein